MSEEKISFTNAVVAASLFVLMLMVGVVLLFRIYLKRKNKLLLEKERMSIQFAQTLLQSKLEIQEQTFAYISGELHDNVGQILSLVSINLNTLHAPQDTAKIKLMDELLGKALTDLRNLSHSLDADHIRDNGWQTPVIKLLQNLENSGKYTTQVTMTENIPFLGTERPIILFRMIQEVINNIGKHANANTIFFGAETQSDKLVITIRDNGKGFNKQEISEGAGLRNLVNRSKLINAGLAIESEPGKGTVVTISIKTDNIE